jgi:hypothetical protein
MLALDNFKRERIMKLLSDANPKILKGTVRGFLTFIMHLAPGSLSGKNVCPGASAGCLFSCLNTAGRGRFDNIQAARIRKTQWFFQDREGFMAQLVKDVKAGIRKAERNNLTPVFRLNGTSDIRWETVAVGGYRNIFEMFPTVQFYDYTKLANRRNIPANYHLTFSRSESNDHLLSQAIGNGMNIAVVYNVKKNDDLPRVDRHRFSAGFGPLPIVDGDETDLRFLDPDGCIVGLRAKGDAKKDTSGFVVHI